MVRANYFKNHVKLEHKQLQYSCFLKASVFECPVCQEMVPPGMLETHFAEGRTCEKALPINHVEVCVKEEDVKMEHDVESWVKKEYVEADKEIKIESGVIIKQEAIEEFHGERPDAEAWVRTAKEEYVEADKEIKIESGVIIKEEAIEEF